MTSGGKRTKRFNTTGLNDVISQKTVSFSSLSSAYFRTFCRVLLLLIASSERKIIKAVTSKSNGSCKCHGQCRVVGNINLVDFVTRVRDTRSPKKASPRETALATNCDLQWMSNPDELSSATYLNLPTSHRFTLFTSQLGNRVFH
jgi:hypothetical protein